MPQTAHNFRGTVSAQLSYLLYLPPEYDGTQKMPLILFLHGAGERGDDLDLAASQGLPKRLLQGADIPFIVVSPQCPLNDTWETHLYNVMALLDHIIETYPVLEDQVYLTGLSMGGYGTWRLVTKFPARFAAAAPICGGMPWLVNPETALSTIRHLPLWVFHGAKDMAVPVEQSRVLVDILKKIGGSIRYTEYPDLQHDSWTVTYNNPELYTWFSKHKRQP